MANIFFWYETQEYDVGNINKVFASLGYKAGKYLELGRWNIIIFPKTGYDIQNWLIFSDGAICGIGTFAYKNKVYEQALPLIASDIRDNKLDPTRFWGSFLILAKIGDRHVFIRDGAGLARLYGLAEKPVYSSSFAGLLRSSSKKLIFNKEAASELLSTGVLTGNETVIKEIEFISVSCKLKSIEQFISAPNTVIPPKRRTEAVGQQVEIVGNFFKTVSSDWFSYMPNSVFDISITGGLDTRLVTAFVLAHHCKTKFHTFWRSKNSSDHDFYLAKIIADYLKIPLSYKEVKPAFQLTEEEIMQSFEAGHNSCDGVISPGSFWDEDFSNMQYRAELTSLPYLRLGGFGGEQYRNVERLPLKSSRSYKSWVHWNMIYHFCGNNFTNKKALHRLEDRIISNIESLLGKGKFNLLTYQEYRRLIIVPSYRSLQINMENRYGFFLSPFADANLSIPAKVAYPFLGNSLQFEIDMLNKVSPDLAKLPNQYGFNFIKGEPLKSKISIGIWQLMPAAVKYRLFSAYKNYKSNFAYNLVQKSLFIRSLICIVESAGLPLNLMGIIERKTRGKLVFNLGYFLKANKEWLKW